jgi:hypothetical protein
MIWIRSARWDAAWILSGLPIGWGLLLLSPTIYLVLALIVLLEHGHFLSPMTLAWGHAGFRRLMLRQPIKYIGLPIALILTTTSIGIATTLFADLHIDVGMKVRVYDFADYKQPFVIMVVLYWFWNAYHFGMQNFGVLSIYRRKSGSGNRRADMIYCLFVQAAASFLVFAPHLGLDRGVMRDLYVSAALVIFIAMMLREDKLSPRILFIAADTAGLALIFWSGLWGFAIWSINHWLVAIGLSSHVYAVHRGRSAVMFVAGLVVVGVALFWLIFGSGVNRHTLFDPSFVVRTTMIALSLRYGFAFTHFLYDRWLWQLSNSEVRATIGKDLFELPSGTTGTHARYECGIAPTGTTRRGLNLWWQGS